MMMIEAAPVGPLGDVVEDRRQGGLARPARCRASSWRIARRWLTRLTRGDVPADLRVERHQAHGVLLVDHQVRQRGRQVLAVLELRQRPAVVPGRLGPVYFIEPEASSRMTRPEVGLFDVLLDVVAVGLAVDPPVEVARCRRRGRTAGARRTRPRSPCTGSCAGPRRTPPRRRGR